MNVLVISNVTMDPLGPFLSSHQARFPGVGAWPSVLAGDAAVDADAVIIHVDVDALRLGVNGPEHIDLVIDLVGRWVDQNPGVPIVLNTALCQPGSPFSFADGVRRDGVVADVARWNEAMRRIAASSPYGVLADLAYMLRDRAMADLTTSRYWYAGRIRYSRDGFESLGALYTAVLCSLVEPARKVLVLDLDNTVWGGVLGEDGPLGILVGEDGVGRCFRDFQFALQQLARAGVLLAVLSKNDPGAIEEVVAANPMQVLDPGDFVDVDLGWDPKPGRLAAMADRLGVGRDALVFLDDSPFERGAMEAAMPEVAVPAFPAHPELLVDWLNNTVVPTHFARAVLTTEDVAKTAQYRAREARRVAVQDGADFLAGLDIKLSYVIDDVRHLARLAQLTQKTNQFNLTTERFAPREMAQLIEASDTRVIGVFYEDRFGREGIVGLAILDLRKAELRNLLLSCRVLGRGVEEALLAEVEEIARAEGIKTLAARYMRSARNQVAADFLDRNGFRGAAGGDTWTGRKELE